MNQPDLESLLEQRLTLREMAESLSTSQTNVRYWLQKYELQLWRGSRGKLPKDSVLYRACPCGETDFSKFYGNKRHICGKCHSKYTMTKGKNKRDRLVMEMGGECSDCGYRDFTCALDVHHLDPSKKDVAWAGMRGWSWERLMKEVESCILLCKNCHAVRHWKQRGVA